MKPTSSWKDKIAVITGASSGIGAAVARRLAAEGMRVFLIARRRERLEQVAASIGALGGRAEIIPADLTREADRQRAFDHIAAACGGADVLVNNAGLGWYGYGSDMPWTIALEIIQVNITATVHFTLMFLKKMHERGSGHIINVGSISGSLPSQGVALYGATKSFLDNFTTALHRELTGKPLHVSVVRAGPVLTEFCSTAALQENGRPLPTEKVGVSAEAVADKVWRLLRHPRRVIYIPGWLAFVPLIENYFGWLIDKVGPLLLKKSSRRGHPSA